MNGTDWPSPATNLSLVEQNINKILAATGVDVPSLSAGRLRNGKMVTFCETVKDEEDLDRIVDYLELKSHDGFIDIDDEAYKERIYELLGMTYKTPPPIVIEKVEVIRHTIGPGESYTKGIILQIDELPRTNANVVAIRAELIKEMDTTGSVQRET
uniref:Mediator of RNA polymerase II transcription subunit 33A-like n=1 Tax=Tanacetum cinerariifolium TaxID=118510 RepID=A0A6L2KQX0_TANCI|nr:mediator of RNA polymerase II transcription subunit 33A-like [Tanacetum cinerariifolium]